MSHMRTGTFTQAATAVAYNVECGFAPDYVEITNYTDGDILRWYKGMSDAGGQLSLAGTAFAGKWTAATGNGITPSGDAATDTFKGFTVGLNANFNIASKVYYWVAKLQD